MSAETLVGLSNEIRDEMAFLEGRAAYRQCGGDVCKAKNNYPAGTYSWRDWNRGWNSHLFENQKAI